MMGGDQEIVEGRVTNLATATAIVILALAVTACTTARFAPTPPQAQATPQQPPAGQHQDLGGPYTREREDREFGERP
jgi:hypothetical protein